MHESNDPYENMTPRYTFESLNRGDRVEMSTSTETWADLADKFYDFLRGCGFILTRQSLADYFDESVFKQRNKDCPVRGCDGDSNCDNHASGYGLQPVDED